jgi:hypothetical protein
MSVWMENRNIHKTWDSMKQRCLNPNCESYPHYGGRGIKVCDRWLNDVDAFYADMGDKPSPDSQIDRIDNNGDYTPDNCRWATVKEQARNRRSNTFLNFNGQEKTIAEWAEDLGIKQNTIIERLRRGSTVEKALTPMLADNKPKKILAVKECFVFIFDSIAEAHRELGLNKASITTALSKGTVHKGYKFERIA